MKLHFFLEIRWFPVLILGELHFNCWIIFYSSFFFQMEKFTMLNPKFYRYYASLATIMVLWKFGHWYTERVDNNMNLFKNKSKLFGGRTVYPEERWWCFFCRKSCNFYLLKEKLKIKWYFCNVKKKSCFLGLQNVSYGIRVTAVNIMLLLAQYC